ncbi:MAG: hypothetical protein ACI4DO_03040 [Roseburia sp.]
MSEKNSNKPLVDERYVRPQAAWEKMKAAQSTGQTVYIYGSTGSGKTRAGICGSGTFDPAVPYK